MPYSRKTTLTALAIFFIKPGVLFARAVSQVRAASFSVLLLLFIPFSANAVHFASEYLIMLEGQLLSMKRKLNAQGQVEITLRPLNSAVSGEMCIHEIQSHLILLTQQAQAPSIQSSFQTVANTLNCWAHITGEPAQLVITLSEDSTAFLPVNYVLGDDHAVDVPQELLSQVYGSGEVTMTSEEGLQAKPASQSRNQGQSPDEPDHGTESTSTQLSTSAELTAPEAVCLTVGHAHNDPGITQFITMFGQAMEKMFGALITSTNEDEGIADETTPTMAIANPLTPVLIGGQLSTPNMPVPQLVTLAFTSGYGHQFTFNSASNTITQQDPPGDPNPGWTSFDYHVNENGEINTIEAYFSPPGTASPATSSVSFMAMPPGVLEQVRLNLGSSFDMGSLSAALATVAISINVKRE